MSYEVIYDTIIVDCGNKYMEVMRQCSSNCFPKPRKSEYMAVIKSKENYIDLVNAYMQNTDDYWTIKVNSRYLTTKQFGEYLNRKVKKAISFDEFLRMARIRKWTPYIENGKEYMRSESISEKEEIIKEIANNPYDVEVRIYK